MNKVSLQIPAIGRGAEMAVDGVQQDMSHVNRLTVDAAPDQITTVFVQMISDVALECEARVEVHKNLQGPDAKEILSDFLDSIDPSDVEQAMLSDGLRRNPAVAALDYIRRRAEGFA